MASPKLFAFDHVALDEFEFDLDDVRAFNPHRHEMEQIDGIAYFSKDPLQALATRIVRDDEFWTRGHFPGNPLFPGILMVEGAAQACSFCFHKEYGRIDGKIFGFGGLEDVRFRSGVKPGDRLAILVKAHRLKPIRAVFDFQCYVGERRICDGRVIGVAIPAETPSESAEA